MRLTRIFVDSELEEGGEVRLKGDPAHHLIKVLRLRQGDELIVFNGRGGEYGAYVKHATRHTVEVGVRDFNGTSRESPLRITLVQGVSRGERMDFTIQKAVELGVSTIVPVLAARSVVRLDTGRRARRQDHWTRVAINACQQCGRTRVPRLAEAVELGHWLENGFQPADGPGFVLSPHARRAPSDVGGIPEAVTLLVGPEGGLSDEEQSRAEAAGLIALALGPRILRTETAAVAALTALQLKWGDLAFAPGSSAPGAGPR